MKRKEVDMVVKKREDGFVQICDGIERQNLAYGEHTHMVKFFLQKGKSVPVHDHPHEQTGYLLKGKMLMNIDGEDYELEEGDSWSIKGTISHGVRMIEDCLVIEIFSPLREDYLD